MNWEIELLLLKLSDGGRVIRFTEPRTGLALEKRIDPKSPVAREKQKWQKVFLSLLEREVGAAR